MLAGFAIIIRVAVICVCRIAAEGSYFDNLAPENNVNDPKAPTYESGVAEQVVHFLRGGVGGYVKIFGLSSKERVAYASANKVCLIAGVVVSAENLLGGLTDNRT